MNLVYDSSNALQVPFSTASERTCHQLAQRLLSDIFRTLDRQMTISGLSLCSANRFGEALTCIRNVERDDYPAPQSDRCCPGSKALRWRLAAYSVPPRECTICWMSQAQPLMR